MHRITASVKKKIMDKYPSTGSAVGIIRGKEIRPTNSNYATSPLIPNTGKYNYETHLQQFQ